MTAGVLAVASRPELVAAVRDSGEDALQLLGAGTRGRCGNAPTRVATLLSLEGMTGVVEYQPAEMVATVEAGIGWDVLDAALAEHGQRLGVRPLASRGATLGGLVAADACGPHRLRFGSWREQVLGLRLVLADGREIRAGGKVVKNVTGYDLVRLVIGSYGTLGAVAELSLRLQPRPEGIAVGRVATGSVGAAGELVGRLRAAPLQPSALLVWQDGGLALELEEAVVAQRQLVEEVAPAAWRWEETPLVEELDLRLVEHRAAAGAVLRGGVPRPTAVLEHLQAPAPEGLEVEAFADPGCGEINWWLRGEGAAAWTIERRRRLEADGGFLVVDEGLPEVDAWGALPGEFELMRAVKGTLDPGGRWNPGQYVGGL